jgi:putative membrane protein
VTWLYIILLPFQCFHSLGWNTIPACVVTAYIILGIAFIGREIEDPFGHDVNDLPLDAFCLQIRQDMDIIMSREAPLSGDFMNREENMPLYPLSYLSTRAWAEKSVEDIRGALAQKVGLRHPMIERVSTLYHLRMEDWVVPILVLRQSWAWVLCKAQHQALAIMAGDTAMFKHANIIA